MYSYIFSIYFLIRLQYHIINKYLKKYYNLGTLKNIVLLSTYLIDNNFKITFKSFMSDVHELIFLV